jgi:ATP-binding cassette subfamily B protein IrtA
MTTVVTEPEVGTPERTPPEEQAKRGAAALAELRRPVIWRIRLAMALAAVVALAELGELLLVSGPLDRGAVITVAWLVVAGLGARGLLIGLGRYAAFWRERDRARGWRLTG